MAATDLLPAATVTRDGVVESVHLAHVVVASPDGAVRTVAGDAAADIYPRSSLKPFQAVAVRAELGERGLVLSGSQLAIASASHTGSDDHQVEAASLLAEAHLDEGDLRCPPAWPDDQQVRNNLVVPTRLSHNCSGKHASMLWAHTAAGQPAAGYLDTDAPLQRRIAHVLHGLLGMPPAGPGTDGCGAPAWRCRVDALAIGFARLAEGSKAELAAVRDAMTTHPTLIGGHGITDTAMMWADVRVVAKRGADGVMGAGFLHPSHGPLGVAVKVIDGGDRASAPVAAAVLQVLGATLPADVLRPPVLGGSQPHGAITATPVIGQRTATAFA